MTAEEINRVGQLRKEGYGYKKIASLTWLSVNTVKTYCRRHPVSMEVIGAENNLCKMCGKPLTQTPHKRKRIFCSDACRLKWWNSHRELVNHRDGHQVVCGHCGQVFSASKKSARKYCSHNCYIAERFHGGEM